MVPVDFNEMFGILSTADKKEVIKVNVTGVLDLDEVAKCYNQETIVQFVVNYAKTHNLF